MATKQQQQLAEHVLNCVGSVNPYNRQGENATNEYKTYQAGFLAAYLASLMLEDPRILKRFEQHINNRKGS